MSRPIRVALLLFTSLAGNAAGQITGFAGQPAISREMRPRTDSRAGNSVDTGTGAFLMEVPVLKVQGRRDLELVLRYNSLLGAGPGRFGQRWVHNFETYLELADPNRPAISWGISWQRVTFRPGDFAGLFVGVDESVRYDRLQRRSDGGWRLERLDGTVYEFGSNGLLLRVANKVNHFLDIQRSDSPSSRLAVVHEPIANRYLFFRYRQDDSGLIEGVSDAEDRMVYFNYDNLSRLTTLYDPVTLGETQGESFSSKPIPDNNSAGVTHIVRVTRREPIGLVELRQAQISHPRPADLTLRLISPRGTEVQLTKRTSGGSAWNLDGMLLDSFLGEDPSGEWRLIVTDRAAGQTGFLQVFKMVFSEPANATHLSYNAAHQITEARASDGARLFSNVYDASGRVVAQDDGVDTNQLALFAWQESGGTITTSYKDRTGALSVFVHDAAYHLLSTTDPLEQSTTFEYSASGDRTAVTNALGRTFRFSYDTSGNMTSVTDPAGNVTTMTFEQPSNHNVIEIQDPNRNATRFTYSGSHSIVKVRDAEGYSDDYTYGSSGGMNSASSAAGSGVRFYYDSSNMLTGADHPAAGYRRPGARYDNIGRLVSMVDADGFETLYEYNSRGDTIATTDPRGKTLINRYDLRGRLIERVDRNGNSTRYSYDGNGNVSLQTDALNRTIRYEYDGEDRLTRVANPLGFGITQRYDAAGQLVAETDAEGNTFRYEYDAAGNLVAALDADGVAITRYAYDARGLRIREEDALGNPTLTSFDATGRPVTLRDPLGRTTTYGYDKLGRQVRVTDPLQRTAIQAHLQDDLLEYFVDAKGQETRFRYDTARRLLQVTANSGRLSNFRYNGRDLITVENRPSGNTVTYNYDEAARLTRILYANAGGTRLSEVVNSYDDQGNLVQVRNSSAANAPVRLRRTYDATNRLTSFTDAAGNRLEYGYDAAGNLIRLTYPDGKAVNYAYDRNGRMIRVTDWAGRVTRYVYDRNGRLTETVLPNGARRLSEYDTAGRLIRRRDLAAAGAVVDLTYRWDAAGQLTAVVGDTAAASGNVANQGLSYDGDNRVTSFGASATTSDAEGNLTRAPLGAGLAPFTYDARNNLTGAGATVYGYDDEDRLVSIVHQGRTTALTVNPEPRLSQILVRNEAGTVSRFVYGIGLLYEERGADIRVHHYDHAGNTIAFTNAAGAVTGRVSYGPYGEILERSGDPSSPFLYGGLFGVYTEPNGLSCMRFRWYSPELRRFLNADAHLGEISNLRSLNRYAYAGSNPILMVDPDGEIFLQLLGGAAVGAISGLAFQFAYDLARGQFSSWEVYAGAAYAGAWTGLVLTACPTCLFTAGALGASAGYLLERGLLREEVDPVELAVTGLVGGATSWAVGKAGEKYAKSSLSKSISGKMRGVSSYFSKFFASSKPANPYVTVVKNAVLRVAGSEAAQTVAKRFVAGLALGLAERLLFPGSEAAAASAKSAIYAAGRAEVTRGRTRAFGEYAHFEFYLSSLRLAGRPLPTLSNNLLTVF